MCRLAIAVLLVGVCLVSVAGAQSVRADFNGDGFDDLAIGIPNERVGTATGAGAVAVISTRLFAPDFSLRQG